MHALASTKHGMGAGLPARLLLLVAALLATALLAAVPAAVYRGRGPAGNTLHVGRRGGHLQLVGEAGHADSAGRGNRQRVGLCHPARAVPPQACRARCSSSTRATW